VKVPPVSTHTRHRPGGRPPSRASSAIAIQRAEQAETGRVKPAASAVVS
jgi:hypothetical protein